MAKKKTEGVNYDDLNDLVAESMAKKFKVQSLADEELITDVTEWISTGDERLDIAISNRPNAGIPVGRMTEFWGKESSGKSLLSAHCAVNVLKEGGMVLYVDTEFALSKEWLKSICDSHGVDSSRISYKAADTLEEAFGIVEGFIETYVRIYGDTPTRKALVIVDSVAGGQMMADVEKTVEKQGYATSRSQVLGNAAKKFQSMLAKRKIAMIVTNQVRQNMQAMGPFDRQFVRPGGKALPHHCSTSVFLNPGKKHENSNKEKIGTSVVAEIIKSRFGPDGRKVTFDVWFDRGIDSITSLLKDLTTFEILKQSGAYYFYIDVHGEEHSIQKGTWTEWKKSHPEAYNEIYKKLCEKMIRPYKAAGTPMDEEYTSSPITEDE